MQEVLSLAFKIGVGGLKGSELGSESATRSAERSAWEVCLETTAAELAVLQDT